MPQFVFNHRILKTTNSVLSDKRIEHHFAHQTVWEIMYQNPMLFGEPTTCSIIAPNREEMYGKSMNIITVPQDCLSPVWSQD
jgi:hypothetical protein